LLFLLLEFVFYFLDKRFDFPNQRRDIGVAKAHLGRGHTMMFTDGNRSVSVYKNSS